MITQGFHSQAVQWLRDERRLSTSVVPHELIADPTEATRVPGSFARPSRAATYAFSGLWALTGGLVLSMLGMPSISVAIRDVAHQIGYLAELGGVALLGLAYITARRHRDLALVEVRPATAEAMTEASLQALHREASGAIAWVVTERVPDGALLECAAALGVRWFAPDRRGFRELARPTLDAAAVDQSSSRNSSTTG